MEDSENAVRDFEHTDSFLHGWRFWFTMMGIYTGMFLVTMEVTVVSTTLVAITDDLKDFEHASWIVNAYFLTWSGFLILWAQFSHTTGRKLSLLLAIGLFVIFSGICAAAQTSTELSVFRGLQGLAGAGVFCLPIVIISEAVPPSALPIYAGFNAVVALFSFAAGPLIGGAIASSTTWRWVFLIDIPIGCLVFLLIFLGLPGSFPYHNKPKEQRPRFRWRSLKQLDTLGGTLFLGATVLIVAALLEADDGESWNSVETICLLASGVASIALFTGWEWFITNKRSDIMPVLTWAFVERRTLAMFMSSFLVGAPFVTTLIQIPQTYQLLGNFTPIQSAIRLLAYILVLPVGCIMSAVCASKFKAKPVYGQLFGAILQLVAVICFIVEPFSAQDVNRIPARQFGFQALMGFGNGFSYTTNLTSMPYALGGRKELVAPAMGANSQFRYLGGAIGLGAITAAFNTAVRNGLATFLDSTEIQGLLDVSSTVLSLDPQVQVLVRRVYANAFILQWKIIAGFIGAQIVANLLTY